MPIHPIKLLAPGAFILCSLLSAQSAPTPETARLQTISIMDDPRHIGGEAYRILAPSDWHAEGSIMWKNIGSDPAFPWIKLIGPAHQEIGILPPSNFLWNPQLLGSRYRAGSFYSGMEVQPPMLDPSQCIRTILIPRYLRNLDNAELVKQDPLPELAQAGRLKYPESRYPKAAFQAGRMRFEFTENGIVMQEDVYVLNVAIQVRSGQTNSIIWAPDEVRYSKAPKGTLDAQLPIFLTTLFSLHPVLPWFAAQQQIAEELGRLQASDSAASASVQQQAAAADRMITRQKMAQENAPPSQAMLQRYQARQLIMNQINSTWDPPAIKRLEVYRNPATGEKIALPSGYSSAWVNGRLDILLATTPTYDPNSPPATTWTRLEK